MSLAQDARVASPPLALVTGASGFVGGYLVRALLAGGWRVRCVTRRPWPQAPRGVERSDSLDIGPGSDWSAALDGIAVVFHLASRAHVTGTRARETAAEFERVNADGTAGLARAARRGGVRRLVYVSSIGVHGNRSDDAALTESSPIGPHNAYSRSKLHAELALQTECGPGLEWVVLRPPLIYGAGAPGNLPRLMRLVASGVPLPLAGVQNARSLVAVQHVVQLLMLCGRSDAASRQCYVAADGDDLSTPELVRTLATGMGRRARLVPFPVAMLRAGAGLIGLSGPIEQLCGTLRVNAAKARSELGWTPSIRPRDGLMETARWYATSRRT